MRTNTLFPSRRWPGPAGWFASLFLVAAILAPTVRAQDPDTLGLSFVKHVQVGSILCSGCPRRICPDKPVVVTVSGALPNGCVEFRGLHQIPFEGGIPALAAEFVVDTCGRACPTVITSFVANVALPASPPGTGEFRLIVNERVCPDTSVISTTHSRTFGYEVEQSCADIPPLDSLVRTFARFDVAPDPRCALDSLTLHMTKNGCPPCLRLESLVNDTGFVATMQWSPMCIVPFEPIFCLPQRLSTPMGQFAAGFHQTVVDVHVAIRNFDTGAVDSVISFQELVSFEVAATCDSTPVGCMYPGLSLADVTTPDPVLCAVQVPPGGRGSVVLAKDSPMPLGGLQGRIQCSAPFRVVGLRAPEAFPGLHVSWVPDGRGARYVLFTPGTGPIPAGRTPILGVAVECDSGAAAGTIGFLQAPLEVASGPAGEEVQLCAIRGLLPSIGLCVAGQTQACDANLDGHADVRDLVLMASCLRLEPPGSSELCRDCNRDGSWAFQDLVCCARHILQLPLVPRDSVNADDVRVSFEYVMLEEEGHVVRVRLAGLDGLGAAMLRLRYPGERWRASVPGFVDRPGADSEGWLPIIDPDRPGVVQLGGLRLAETASAELTFLVKFTPTGTPLPGDQVAVEGADLAGSDGTAFTLATLPSLTLSSPGSPTTPNRVSLGAARPNPFARTTVFTVSLPREADVDLAIHDVAGRRMATLLSGRIAAGEKDATWNANGARDGVYFARLVVDGEVYTQRVALLRGRR